MERVETRVLELKVEDESAVIGDDQRGVWADTRSSCFKRMVEQWEKKLKEVRWLLDLEFERRESRRVVRSKFR